MRILRGIATLVALGTIGFALGDFASHPNPLGALGLMALFAIVGFLLSYLYRAPRSANPKVKPEPEPEPGPEAETLQKRPRKKAETVWAGWGAEEAQVAREQRREKRRR